MVIVNALPKFGVICAVFVCCDMGVATDEVQIELGSGRGRHIVLESGKSKLYGSHINNMAGGLMAITGLKASEALGVPRFEHNWSDSVEAIRQLDMSFAYQIGTIDLENAATLYAAANQDFGRYAVEEVGSLSSAIIGVNTHWFTSHIIANLG